MQGRSQLLGLSAMLNVCQSHLDTLGREFRPAGTHINKAVVELSRLMAWTPEELERMGEVQNDLVETLLDYKVGFLSVGEPAVARAARVPIPLA